MVGFVSFGCNEKSFEIPKDVSIYHSPYFFAEPLGLLNEGERAFRLQITPSKTANQTANQMQFEAVKAGVRSAEFERY